VVLRQLLGLKLLVRQVCSNSGSNSSSSKSIQDTNHHGAASNPAIAQSSIKVFPTYTN
jgi:hypothetical protein